MLRLSKSQMCHCKVSLVYDVTTYSTFGFHGGFFYGCRAKRLLFKSTLTNDEWDDLSFKKKICETKNKELMSPECA